MLCLLLGSCVSGDRPDNIADAFVHASSLQDARKYLLHPEKTTVLENGRHNLFTPSPYPITGSETLAPNRVVVWVKGVAVSGFVHPDHPFGLQLVRERRSWKIDLGASLNDPGLVQRNRGQQREDTRKLRQTMLSLRRAVRAYYRSYNRWPASVEALRGKTPWVVEPRAAGYRFTILSYMDERGEPYLAALHDTDQARSFTLTLIGEKRSYPPPASP